MLSYIRKYSIRLTSLLLLLGFAAPAWAAGPPEPSIFDNPLAITFVILMLLLLIIIGILGYLLIGTADLKLKKSKKATSLAPAAAAAVTLLLLLTGPAVLAQGGAVVETTNAAPAAVTIGGLAPSTFYVMVAVIFLELVIIIALLLNIRSLLRVERAKLSQPATEAEVLEAKKNHLSWWDKFNSLRPVTQESELDLGHDYDGIRELNNRLPRWWIYGFYFTILFAGVYLYRFHVSHTAPSSKEEYEAAVAAADAKVEAYLKQKGENIDENTVTFLSGKDDLEAGKAKFTGGACVSCHGNDGSGLVFGQPGVGPNLTDDYWLHGGSIKNIFTTIKYGVAGKGMQAWGSTYSAKEIAQISSYIKTLRDSKPAKGKDPQGELYKEEAAKPATDTLKTLNDSIKAKDNKVALN